MISQNFKILSKLDTLISAQQLIDDRLKKIEGSSDESSSEEVIKTIVVEVARNLLKVSIYPSQNEFREETEKVLRSSFPELHKKFRQSPIFYEKNIYKPLLAKHRSFRGSLTSRIKDALYTIFPNSLLSPQIRLHPKFGSGKAIQLWQVVIINFLKRL